MQAQEPGDGRSLPGPEPRQSAASPDRFGQHSSAGVAGLSDLAEKSFFRAHEAAELGVHSRALGRLVNDGSVERVARGVYRLAEAELTEHYTHAAVCVRVPRAIVCLLTALRVHDLGTQLPRKVWIAIPAQGPHAPHSGAAGQGGPLLWSLAALRGRENSLRRRSRAYHQPSPHRRGLLPLPPTGRHERGPRGAPRRPT